MTSVISPIHRAYLNCIDDASTSGEVAARSHLREIAQSLFCDAANVCERVAFRFWHFYELPAGSQLVSKKQEGFGVFAMKSARCGFRRTQPVAIVQAAP
jgi:hypothetical protein